MGAFLSSTGGAQREHFGQSDTNCIYMKNLTLKSPNTRGEWYTVWTDPTKTTPGSRRRLMTDVMASGELIPWCVSTRIAGRGMPYVNEDRTKQKNVFDHYSPETGAPVYMDTYVHAVGYDVQAQLTDDEKKGFQAGDYDLVKEGPLKKRFNVRGTNQPLYNPPAPKIHATMKPVVAGSAPIVSSAATSSRDQVSMELVKKRYAATELVNLAGAITNVKVPDGWLVRAWSGRNFDGALVEFPAGTHIVKPSVGQQIFSLELLALRPMIMSTPVSTSANAGTIFMAALTDDVHLSRDLDNGIFFASNKQTYDEQENDAEGSYRDAGIAAVWVPDGFVVHLFGSDVEKSSYTNLPVPGATPTALTAERQTIYGNNAQGWTSVREGLEVRSIHVLKTMPMFYSEYFFGGTPYPLPLGTFTLPTAFTPKSIFIPQGMKVKVGYGEWTASIPRLSRLASRTITVSVIFVETKDRDTVDNLPVRTKVFVSNAKFESECREECSSEPTCVAYYAHRFKEDCPNPMANKGEDPAVDGCRSVCGFYEVPDTEINMAMQTAETVKIPGAFQGTLYTKVMPT